MRFAPQWKWRLIIAGVLFFITGFFLAGCPSVPSREEVNSGLTAATTQAHAAVAALDQEINRLRATTQPTATMPDFVPTPEQITVEAQQEKPLVVAKQGLETAIAKAAPVIQAVNNGADPGQVIQAAAPATGPAAPYVYIAGVAVSVGFGLWKWYDDYKTRAAAQANIAAIQVAVAAGTIAVKPEAANAVGANTPEHPLADQLVQVLTVPPVPKV